MKKSKLKVLILIIFLLGMSVILANVKAATVIPDGKVNLNIEKLSGPPTYLFYWKRDVSPKPNDTYANTGGVHALYIEIITDLNTGAPVFCIEPFTGLTVKNGSNSYTYTNHVEYATDDVYGATNNLVTQEQWEKSIQYAALSYKYMSSPDWYKYYACIQTKIWRIVRPEGEFLFDEGKKDPSTQYDGYLNEIEADYQDFNKQPTQSNLGNELKIKETYTYTDANLAGYTVTGTTNGVVASISGNTMTYTVPNSGDFEITVSKTLGDPAVKPRLFVDDLHQNNFILGSATKSFTFNGKAKNVGNLRVCKVDNHGKLCAGAVLHVTGPLGFDQTVTTLENDYITWNEIECGTYYIEEVTAPNNMIRNKNVITQELTDNTITVEINNNYQRGSVSLLKYDAEHRDATLGDSTLNGAVYNLYAKADIYEGRTKIYSANEVIKGNITTKADGTTDAVTNLPIGTYYYKEITPSNGFNLNPSIFNVEVVYAGQDSTIAKVGSVEAPEYQIKGNFKINKKLEASDYDAETNLEGARFKLTLKSNNSQEYFTNVSGKDGICKLDNIPYGTYIVEECNVPASALKVNNFEVVIDTDGKLYEYTLVDKSKKMLIEVNKELLVNEGERTDAKVEGAIFTLYTDAQCLTPYKDKNGKTVTLGPTDARGHAKTNYIKTGTYYLKETTFPEGIDADAVIPNENVTYRNKVYVASLDNAAQTEEIATFTFTVKNEPKRNSIEIIKKVGETSNTEKFPLDQCEFTATLKSTIGTDNVFSRKCTAETTRDTGYCIIEDLPYGEYVVEETKVSPISLKCANFDIFVGEDKKVQTVAYQPKDATKWYGNNPLDSDNSLVNEPKVMDIKVIKVDTNRTDVNPVDYMQGDAELKGAIYQIYRYDPMTDAYTEYVYDITVDHQDSDGYWCAEARNLLVGNYMIKEKIKSTEIVDGKEVKYSYATGYLVDENEYFVTQDPATQTVKTSYHTTISKEEVLRGQVKVIKYDNILGSTDNISSEGAILRLTLDSNPEIWYEATIRKDGTAEFIDVNDAEHSTSVKTNYGNAYLPNTIPYGHYTITETKESNNSKHTSFFIQPENVFVEKQEQVEYRIESDNPVELYLKVQKRDKDTNATVALAGAKFKVWDVAKKEFITQKTYPDGKYIDEFTTNVDGYLYLPDKIQAGDYIIYETEAPKGYYLEDDLRLPEKESDIGKKGKGGTYLVINKASLKVVDSIVSSDIELEYVVNQADAPLKGKIEIFKEGEVLVDASTQNSKYGDVYSAKYEKKGLEGVTYKVIAVSDIKSPDGTQTYVTKDTVVDTITTNSEGLATTKDLYLGEYKLVETKAPAGYLIDSEIDNVTLTNEDQYVKVKPVSVKLGDDRQKLQLTINKIFNENKNKYSSAKTNEKTAIFKVCAAEDIKNYAGKTIIAKDSIVYILEYKDGKLNYEEMDLPSATYYVEEVDCSIPYTKSDVVLSVKVNPTTSQKPVEVYNAGTLTNDSHVANLMMLKISSAVGEKIVFNGATIDTSKLDQNIQAIISQIKSMDSEKINDYLKNNNKMLAGARYQVFCDENCDKPLYKENDEGEMEEVFVVSDEYGKMILEELPLNTYYLKELNAPVGYTISKDPIKVQLTKADENTIVYIALNDDLIVEEFIQKTDVFTSKGVPNCKFEFRNKDDEVIYYGVTDVEGKAFIPVELFEAGEKYYFVEVEAPDIYELNTDKHEFVADYEYVVDENGNSSLHWKLDKVEVDNYRKTKPVLIRKIDDKTGEPLQGCKFDIVLLDNEGNPFVNPDGETIYLVQGAVTDEKGEYLIEKAPYGSYRFIEVEAPEGYDLAEQNMEGYEFTVNAESGELIEFVVTNTGDIAVIALAMMAGISILGIVLVIVRKKVRV